ncbi:baseplate multidomain protein megatron [Rhodopseudomonas palustris]|uniref:Gene transfer agent (GTA) like protein n=1 Tax=Rhodopseudomonas palustris TaxID=1076 RepID=A0A418V489_RHOPL|nr:glycoside hydrolase/phage tail family protein [Rhodopseudomonas palustris]RJF70862.1 hypothetical protein D4Q52_14625 [Rhodopseudomonas palustris]
MAALSLGLVGWAFGGPVGGLLGTLAGSLIDRAIAGTKENRAEGPRLEKLSVMKASEGEAVLRTFGRMRLDTQLIWASRFREVASSETVGGGKGGTPSQQTTTTTYSYYISIAVGLCEGPIMGIGAIWADGNRLDVSKLTWRLYYGDEAQGPDPKIEAVEGAGRVPAFRGLAYIVFEELPLEQFGNRIPMISVETIRRPRRDRPQLEELLKGVSMIPSLGEFAYATDTVYNALFANSDAQNRYANAAKADFLVALDQLQTVAPNIKTVSLVVAWHGTDLRCGNCQIKPKVEAGFKFTTPWSWQVSGIDRESAEVVSRDAVGVLLGGAPADRSVVQAITELKARGLRVVLYPFVMMDVPPGNHLPNPYSDNAAGVGQPAFPWRGRITCSPAPGFAGTVDKTATASAQVAAFFGSAAASHFGPWSGDTIAYSGPSEWSYRRMVLHLAKLAVAAGGVDAFLIGSEMIGLTTIRSGAGSFPAVDRLVTLAADVKAIVGGCKVGYAADWTEYANYRPRDGSNDVYFHLDPLWASSAIDFIGIDNYMPLSDWRDGDHIDAAEARSIYDRDYLQSNIEGGELYDWYYASAADRTAQVRTAVTDTAYGEPWVFRYKDIRGWWLSPHHNRPGGVRSAASTAWQPQSKPVWFTEFGCPAIDRGTNQPNVFYDPKSSESFLPYFSRGRRDDLSQRSYLEALIEYWDPAAGRNPTSAVYHAPMIATDCCYAWTWDARPYPQFPAQSSVWRDGGNWRRGHWLTGRLGLALLPDVVADLTRGLGVEVDVSALYGVVRGYTIDAIMSARAALSTLMTIYMFDAVESGGRIRFIHRGGPVVASFTADDLADGNQRDVGGFYTLTRAQETDLPRTAHLKFLDPDNDYQVADVYARRLRGSSQKAIEITPAIALDPAEAQGIVEVLLVDAWVMREAAQITLPPSAYALEPTDMIELVLNGRRAQLRIEQLGTDQGRAAVLRRSDAATYVATEGVPRPRLSTSRAEPGPAVLKIMDLPMLTSADSPGRPRLAAFAEPWAGVAVYRSPTTTGYVLDQLLPNASTIGLTTAPLFSGPLWRWDRVNGLYVQVPTSKALASADEALILSGANACAVQNGDGEWEVLQFAAAELIGAGLYRLTNLLRGQLGSESAMRDPVAAGAAFVLLDSAVVPAGVSAGQRGAPLNWKWGPAGRAIDDEAYRTTNVSFSGIGLRPYAPAHLRGLWRSDGGIEIGWIRRTRIDGDSWDALEVPLGEETESYHVEILHPATGAVVRTASTASPNFGYAAAMQITDFGALQTTLKLRVFQISPSYGRGAAATAQLYDDRRA